MRHKICKFLTIALLAVISRPAWAQTEPASEPSVVAVNKVWPAVVNINTEGTIRRTVADPFDSMYNQFFGGPLRRPREFRQKVQSLGSGFIVDADGYIVTNQHVVERATDLKIQVTTTDGKTYEAKYIAGDPKTDLAFIKIDGKTPFPHISLTDISPNLLGESVLALGNPLGYGVSVSRGIVSALDRTITVNDTEYKKLIQTDAAINPGNSGGPLIDISGKLIGISSVKMAYSPQGVPVQGLGFGIPASVVRDKIEEFKHPQKVTVIPAVNQSSAQRCFGLQIQDLTPDLAGAFGIEENMGVLVSDVEENSPARAAGFKRGLVIYKIGRYDITSAQQVESLLADVKPGADADFTVGVVRRVGGREVERVQTVSLTAR